MGLGQWLFKKRYLVILKVLTDRYSLARYLAQLLTYRTLDSCSLQYLLIFMVTILGLHHANLYPLGIL